MAFDKDFIGFGLNRIRIDKAQSALKEFMFGKGSTKDVHKYIEKATRSLKKNNIQQALEEIDKAIKRDSSKSSFEARLFKVDLLLELNTNHEEKITLLEDALRIVAAIPFTEYLYLLGTIYGKMTNAYGQSNRPDLALQCARLALSCSPSESTAWYEHGLALYELDQWKQAIESFDTNIFLEKRLGVNLYSADSWFNKGLCFLRLGDFPKAHRCSQEAYKLDKTFKDAQDNITLLSKFPLQFLSELEESTEMIQFLSIEDAEISDALTLLNKKLSQGKSTDWKHIYIAFTNKLLEYYQKGKITKDFIIEQCQKVSQLIEQGKI